jgi:diamine N-acetyltransferase
MDTGPGPDRPIINFAGEKVALGPRRRDLVPLYQAWLNDFEVTRTLAVSARPMTREQEEGWYERAGQREGEVGFTIYECATMRPVGNTGLHKIDLMHRTAEFGIMIGEKACWGKGYGTEATQLMLDYGFNALSLHSITLRVFSYHERGIRAYTRAGFRVAGRWREAHQQAGQFHDVILMDCLASEFRSRVLRRVLAPDPDPEARQS